MGYDVTLLTEKSDYVIPNWIDKEYINHNIVPMSDPKLTVGPEDVMVIPEVFSNVMEQTKNLPCLRIGFLQSIDYMVNALIPGTEWTNFGVFDIITTSESLKELVELYYGKNKYNIRVYDIGIPNYFEKSKLPQKPIISILGRNSNEMSKIIKLFYNKYPQYNWISFDPMLTKSKPPQAMRRVDFAKRLQDSFAAIWCDRIASFGTFPLECMKSGVIPICLKPDLIPDYMVERDKNGNIIKFIDGGGVWTDNLYDIPLILGDILTKFIDDSIDPNLYQSMDEIVSKYTQENSKTTLTNVYEDIVNKRIDLFKNAIEPTKN